ncbi:GHKL domain-containing protein [Companilactobacillus suantsaicola]|uniref:GHKL domain-containing protein n=1 Tax=Companilactobacillus suantsaicola TaxID=2487723 RepID=A0A4Z0JNC7_9LACO|nr:GHKL domain-containing protein [Companilactobacillus suantsaicola]
MVYIDWQLNLIANFCLLFAILQLKNYFIREFNPLKILIGIALALVFGYIGLFLDDIFILFFIGLLLLVYHHDMQKSISLVMASNIVLVFFCLATYTARIIFFVANNRWQLRLLEIYQEYFITASLLINLLYLVVFVLVAQRFRHSTAELWLQIEKYHLGKRVLTLTFSVLVSFLVILLISDLQAVTATIQASLILIFSILLIVAYYQLVFFVHTMAIQNEAREKLAYNKQLNEYLTSVQQQYTELRKFKHDFQNIMLAIKPLVDQSDSQELKDYYQDIVPDDEMSLVNKGNIAQVSAIDNDLIRGLLIQKFFIAKSKQIDFNLELTQAHYHFNVDIVVVRILGILIDNALEHVTKNREVTCAINQTEQTTEITIDNPLEKKLNLNEIFQSGYTTKQDHTGFGLSNVRKLISQTNNLFLDSKIVKGHLLMTLIIVGGE